VAIAQRDGTLARRGGATRRGATRGGAARCCQRAAGMVAGTPCRGQISGNLDQDHLSQEKLVPGRCWGCWALSHRAILSMLARSAHGEARFPSGKAHHRKGRGKRGKAVGRHAVVHRSAAVAGRTVTAARGVRFEPGPVFRSGGVLGRGHPLSSCGVQAVDLALDFAVRHFVVRICSQG